MPECVIKLLMINNEVVSQLADRGQSFLSTSLYFFVHHYCYEEEAMRQHRQQGGQVKEPGNLLHKRMHAAFADMDGSITLASITHHS